jgi:proteasome lid subunit RPN8/RPN11
MRIAAPALEALRRHVEAAFPEEGCGVLLGRSQGTALRAEQAVACANAHPDRRGDRYQIDPRDLARLQRQARDRGQEIVGFYHSHPGGAAHPSATDLDQAHWLGCVYLIAEVRGGQAGAARAWFLAGTGEEDKTFREEELRVEAA